MKDTFCDVQFKNMFLSSILLMFAENLSDTVNYILAAQLFGDNAMAAVNLVTPLLYSVCFLSSLIATGSTYLYSFEIGSFRHEKANKLVGQGAILAVTSSILLTLILFFGQDVFFSFFDVTGEIETFAREYYSLFFLSAAINPVYFLMFVIVFADGGGKNGVIANFLSLLVNVISSIILGMKFGIAGISFWNVFGLFVGDIGFCKMDFL